jgi:hypothetical protein
MRRCSHLRIPAETLSRLRSCGGSEDEDDEMHFSGDTSDKASHHPDIENGVGSANGSIVVNDGGRVQRTKIVVVGLGMVALSFMCVLPRNVRAPRCGCGFACNT